MEAQGPDSRTFADRLNHLWETVHPPGRPYTYEQVAQGIAERGFEISVAYLWQLRNGTRTNPTLQHIQGLAAFFGVPAAYFIDEAEEERVNKQLGLVAALRDADVRNVALRTHGLGERDLAALNAMIDSLREARGLATEASDQPRDES